MDTHNIFLRFGLALILGALIGLQREISDKKQEELFAGVRTFALLSLGGALAAYITEYLTLPFAFLIIAAFFVSLVVVAYYNLSSKGHVGITSEVASILAILLGGLAYWEQYILAGALTVTITVVLSIKTELQTISGRITREDVYATLKFLVITAIVLPILPDRSFWEAPFDVFNPYKIWLMVVFISAISFLGYVLIKVVGTKRGITLTGLLGGLVSSTAVTASFSQRSKTQEGLSNAFTFSIVLAWTVMFVRVVIEILVVNSRLLSTAWLPLTMAGGSGLLYGTFLFFTQKENAGEQEISFSNPFELKPAITFGILYAVVLFVSKAAQMYWGGTGIYLSSMLAGLTDVDAITLSMAELSKGGTVDSMTASRAILLAALSNTAVKGGLAFINGSATLKKRIVPAFVIMFVSGMVGILIM